MPFKLVLVQTGEDNAKATLFRGKWVFFSFAWQPRCPVRFTGVGPEVLRPFLSEGLPFSRLVFHFT